MALASLHEKVPSLYTREGRKIFLSPEIGNLGLEIFHTNKPRRLTLAFPVTFSPFMIQLKPPCLVRSSPNVLFQKKPKNKKHTNVLFLCLKGIEKKHLALVTSLDFHSSFFALSPFSDLLFGITEANQLHYLYHVSFQSKGNFSVCLYVLYTHTES